MLGLPSISTVAERRIFLDKFTLTNFIDKENAEITAMVTTKLATLPHGLKNTRQADIAKTEEFALQ